MPSKYRLCIQFLLYFTVTATLAACESSSYFQLDGCVVRSQGQLVLGTGIDVFEPLSEEQELSLTAGFQGGYHIYGSLRLPKASAGPARIAINLCQDDQVVALARLNDDLTVNGSHAEYLGVLVIMVNTFLPTEIAEEESLLIVGVEDALGQRHIGSQVIKPTCCSSVGNAQ